MCRSNSTMCRPAGEPPTELSAAPGAANAYTASSYDKLVDAPVEASKFDEFTFNRR